jgi:hypothetical protein
MINPDWTTAGPRGFAQSVLSRPILVSRNEVRASNLQQSCMSEPLPVRATYFETPRTYRIDGDALVVSPLGTASESIPLREIVEIRLSHHPARFQPNRFRCRVTPRQGRAHTINNAVWLGPVSEKLLVQEYRDFVGKLCAAVAAANPEARFLRGRSRAALFLENGILVALLAILISVWVALKPRLHWFQIVNLALIAVYVPFAVRSWRKNLPGTFDPRSVPSDILPASEP